MHTVVPPYEPQISADDAGTTAVFLFDYESVEPPGADSVFELIQTCLERSEGVCALSDAGLLSARSVLKFSRSAAQTKTVEGGVVASRHYASITPSAAALWTDCPSNVDLFHTHLNLHAAPRYHGAMLLSEAASYQDFLRFCHQRSPAMAERGFLDRAVEAGLSVEQALIRRLLCVNLRSELQRVRSVLGRAFDGARVGRLGAGAGIVVLVALVAVMVGLISRRAPEVADVDPGAGQQEAVTPTSEAAEQPFEVRAPLVDALPQPVKQKADLPARDSAPEAAPPLAIKRDAASVIEAPVEEGSFGVQVGSFRNAANAANLAKKLSSAGYPAAVRSAKLPNGQTMHRVRVGHFETSKGARRFGDELKRREPYVEKFFVVSKE